MPTIAEVRAKFPQYADLSDADLAGALHKTFYADMPQADFFGKIGFTPPDPLDINGAAKESDGPVTSALGYADGLVRAADQGLTMGFGDEINARMRAGVRGVGNLLTGNDADFSGAYDRALADERARNKDFAAANPISAAVAETVGGVGSLALGGGAPKLAAGAARGVAGLAGRDVALSGAEAAVSAEAAGGMLGKAADLTKRAATSNAVTGAALGAASGFGNAEGGFDNRAESALAGGVVGGALGAGVPLLIKGIGAAASPFIDRMNPQTAARKEIAKALERDGLTPADAARRVEELGPDAMLADVGGDNLTGLARGVAGMPGKAKQAAREALDGRQDGQAARIVGEVRDRLGATGDDFHADIDALMRKRAQEAAPLYDAAFAARPVWSERLQAMLDDPIMRKGLGQGVEIQRMEALAAGRKFNPEDLAITRFNEAGDPVLEGVANMRTLDATKRGMDNILDGYRDSTTGKLALDQRGRAIDQLRRALLDEMDALNPEYAAARAAWAGPSQAMDAMARGRAFIKSDAEITAKQLSGLSASDRDFFRAGAARALRDMIYAAPDGADGFKRIFGNSLKREKLQALFGDAFPGFEKAMRRETQMHATRAAVQSGSRTAPMLAEMGDIGGGNPLVEAAKDAARGSPLAAAGRLMGEGWARLKAPPEKVRDELAPLLFTPADRLAAALAGRPLKSRREMGATGDALTRALALSLAQRAGDGMAMKPDR
jgi:hypothetical protein